jgi:hypothetical protein
MAAAPKATAPKETAPNPAKAGKVTKKAANVPKPANVATAIKEAAPKGVAAPKAKGAGNDSVTEPESDAGSTMAGKATKSTSLTH